MYMDNAEKMSHHLPGSLKKLAAPFQNLGLAT